MMTLESLEDLLNEGKVSNRLIAIGYLAFLLNEQGTKCLKKDIAIVLS